MRTIAHISDLHFGRHDPAIVAALAADLNEIKPSVIIASGDFTQRARRRQYQAARDFLAQMPRPALCVPGNHDIPMFDLARRFFWPLRRYQKYIAADLNPSFQDDELLVVGINTARRYSLTWDGFWKDGRISAGQIEAARARLCDAPPDVFKVVVTHHPFIPPPGQRMKGIVLRPTRALDQFGQCGVDMLLAGHLHRAYSGDIRSRHEAIPHSILSIQASSAVSTRRRGDPNSYNLITIDNARVTVEIRAHGSAGFGTWMTSRFERRDHVWHEVAGLDGNTARRDSP